LTPIPSPEISASKKGKDPHNKAPRPKKCPPVAGGFIIDEAVDEVTAQIRHDLDMSEDKGSDDEDEEEESGDEEPDDGEDITDSPMMQDAQDPYADDPDVVVISSSKKLAEDEGDEDSQVTIDYSGDSQVAARTQGVSRKSVSSESPSITPTKVLVPETPPATPSRSQKSPSGYKFPKPLSLGTKRKHQAFLQEDSNDSDFILPAKKDRKLPTTVTDPPSTSSKGKKKPYCSRVPGFNALADQYPPLWQLNKRNISRHTAVFITKSIERIAEAESFQSGDEFLYMLQQRYYYNFEPAVAETWASVARAVAAPIVKQKWCSSTCERISMARLMDFAKMVRLTNKLAEWQSFAREFFTELHNDDFKILESALNPSEKE
jgi:hypothetical protein